MNHAPHIDGMLSHVLENGRHFLEFNSVNCDRMRGAEAYVSLADPRHPQKIAREICDLMGCYPLHKDRVPAFRLELKRYGVQISERRARGIYNGEVFRLWDDERSAMEMALARLRSAKDRLTYVDAARKISSDLAAAGYPLTHMQEQVISRSLH